MIDILPVIMVIVLIINSRLVKPAGSIDEEYLSLESSKYYRGLFALMIVFHHLSQKVSTGVVFPFFLKTGTLAVSFFFFLSGYGLQKSYIKKGEAYKKSFLKKRIPGVLIPYIVFIAVYWLVNSIVGKGYSVKDVLGSFVNGDPIVTYSWYIIVILVFYLFYWLSMIICRNPKQTILCGCIWYVLWVLFCYKMDYEAWWFRTAPLLIWGLIYATYEKDILLKVKKHYAVIAPVVWIGFVLLFLFKDSIVARLPHQFLVSSVLQPVLSFLFVCSMMLIFMKWKIGNPVLGFLGGISLELYLIHGLFIDHIQIQNDFLRCLAVISLSVVTAFLIHLVLSLILKKNRKPIQEKH